MIIPTSRYPSQTELDANYPQGKARNVTGTGDHSGTPWEKDLINDIFGLFQALVLNAGISPSGVPDNANASDLLSAIKFVAKKKTIGVYAITQSVTKNATELFPLTLIYQFGGFALASNLVTVPAAGEYLVRASGQLVSTDTTNGLAISMIAKAASGEAATARAKRYSTTTTDGFSLFAEFAANIATPASSAISVVSNTASLNFVTQDGLLVIERVG